MPDDFDVTPFPASRRIVVDAGRAASRRHSVLGLLLLDVTEARRRLAEQAEPRPSLTAYLVASIARAAAEHPEVHAYRDLRGRLWVPRRCDVNVSVEVALDGRSFPLNHVLSDAGSRSPADLAAELRRVKADPGASPTLRMAGPARLFLRLPAVIRAWLLGLIVRLPRLQQRLAGTIGVTSVGMFGRGPAWGVALQIHTLDVVIGGLDTQPRYVGEEIEPREMLHVTLMLDHDVVDGAPAARFAARLRSIVESGDVLDRAGEPGRASGSPSSPQGRS